MLEEKWNVLGSRLAYQHPYVSVHLQQVQLPNGRIIPDWPMVHTRDYVNAMVLNDSGQAMVLEGYKHGLGRVNWQVLGGYLEEGEEPLLAAKRELLEETGYQSHDWQHLGRFVMDANRHVGVGYFFLARDAHLVAEPDHDDLEQFTVRWVTVNELKRALFDGRVAVISYAVNLALGLLVLDQARAGSD